MKRDLPKPRNADHRPVPADQGQDQESGTSVDRRSALVKAGKLVAYVAPVVLLYKPRSAFAASPASGLSG